MLLPNERFALHSPELTYLTIIPDVRLILQIWHDSMTERPNIIVSVPYYCSCRYTGQGYLTSETPRPPTTKIDTDAHSNVCTFCTSAWRYMLNPECGVHGFSKFKIQNVAIDTIVLLSWWIRHHFEGQRLHDCLVTQCSHEPRLSRKKGWT